MKPEVYTIYKNSVPTSKKAQSTSITNTNWSMLFREIIAVYHENETKHTLRTKRTVLKLQLVMHIATTIH